MFTIIGGDGKEYGPVTADQLRAWLAAGRANLETQARAAGSTEWRRLGDFPEFNGSASAAPPPLAVAVTPAPAGDVDPKVYADDLIARAAPLDVFECLGRAFNLWMKHFLPLVGVTLLVMLATVVAGMIPIIGLLSNVLLTGIFYGGLYYYYLGRLRGQPREVGDAFAGFSKALVPLMLATLFTTLLTLVIAMPFFFSWVLFIKVALEGARTMPAMPSGGMWLLTLVGLVIVIYISVAWSFTFALVIDKGLSPWTAMEVSRRVVTKQWFRVFFVLLLGWFLMMLGLIGLVIGIFFTMPIMFCALICAYEELCSPPPAATPTGVAADTPTSPTIS